MPATLERIFLADTGGAGMRAVPRVEALPSRGLAGDRYCTGRGKWAPDDVCQVTMIAAEQLEAAEAALAIPLQDGQHRRNLVVRGLDPHRLGGMIVRIGEVRLAYDRPRPPCGYICTLTDKRMYKALFKYGSGVCWTVQQGGELAEGMAVEVEGPNRDLFSGRFERFLRAFR